MGVGWKGTSTNVDTHQKAKRTSTMSGWEEVECRQTTWEEVLAIRKTELDRKGGESESGMVLKNYFILCTSVAFKQRGRRCEY